MFSPGSRSSLRLLPLDDTSTDDTMNIMSREDDNDGGGSSPLDSRRASLIKLAYFGIMALLVFCFTLAILVTVNKTSSKTGSIASRLDAIEKELSYLGPVTNSPVTNGPTDSAPTGNPIPVTTPANQPTGGPPTQPNPSNTTPANKPTDGPVTASTPSGGASTSRPLPGCITEVPDELKFDCHPENGTSEERCLARGCCWHETNAEWSPVPSVPSCSFPDIYGHGYEEISRIEGDDRTVVHLRRRGISGFPNDIERVAVEVTSLDENRLRIKLFDPTSKRFEVQLPPLNLVTKRVQGAPNYKVSISNDLQLQVTRVSTNDILFDTDLTKLIFSDQFLQLSNKVPATTLYGIGEHRDVFRFVRQLISLAN